MKNKIVSLLSVSLLCFSLAFSPLAECNNIPTKAEAKTYVYYATYSKRFHSSKHCRTLARSKNIYKVTKKKAKSIGLTKCKVCY